MKPSEIAAALRSLIAINRPAFIWGAPGVGKSNVLAQVAADLGRAVVDIRAVLLDPVDLRGLPHVNGDGRAHWAIPDFLPREGEGILFLDELNAAPPLVQAACYQLVLDRRLGEYCLPEGWAVLAAGNRESDRAAGSRTAGTLPPTTPSIPSSATPASFCLPAVSSIPLMKGCRRKRFTRTSIVGKREAKVGIGRTRAAAGRRAMRRARAVRRPRRQIFARLKKSGRSPACRPPRPLASCPGLWSALSKACANRLSTGVTRFAVSFRPRRATTTAGFRPTGASSPWASTCRRCVRRKWPRW